MKLSKNFTLEEFTKSQVAIRHGIPNTPSPEEIENLKALCENIIQPVRDHLGEAIFISSGYRSQALNTAIGGALGSQHQKGEAADLESRDNSKLFFAILSNGNFDQLIWEFGDDNAPAWVHVSYRRDGKNRGQIFRALKSPSGHTKYIPFSINRI
ncbi:MAG: Peptidase M15 [Candidatus Methanofastidiosum methylothiophilum]|uniref:Peptidase M15 n=1 Tax=Candidatus Methanofastidiosum methylothiophilum TaxID=1705564 RepID=A0A150ISG8_9EURY|nr:MAG: Peptidase M15 [Candidatus Methanofastidiosum methylthiophilus]KYC53523.1 MAG: Peptidase M15 [Candidatus Methanofastidiosum methylthiophilus]